MFCNGEASGDVEQVMSFMPIGVGQANGLEEEAGLGFLNKRTIME
jgi:hypothetical protein